MRVHFLCFWFLAFNMKHYKLLRPIITLTHDWQPIYFFTRCFNTTVFILLSSLLSKSSSMSNECMLPLRAIIQGSHIFQDSIPWQKKYNREVIPINPYGVCAFSTHLISYYIPVFIPMIHQMKTRLCDYRRLLHPSEKYASKVHQRATVYASS